MKDVSESKSNNHAIAILGVPFDCVTMDEALPMVHRMVASRRPHYVVTANVDFLVQARMDVELRRILLDAHLVLCDGTPLVWASKFLGNPLPERVAGADLVPRLIRIAAEQKLRLFFLGGTPESIAHALTNVKSQYPDLSLEGYSPPFNHLLEMDHAEIKRRIAAAKPDLLFVSFGCPKQEKWIAMHYQSLGVPVAVGVGGTIDFLAGSLKRAPVWMQRTGTEWLFRLAQEPRRLFRRYARDLWMFGWLLLMQWRMMWLRGLAFRHDAKDCAPCGQTAPTHKNHRPKGIKAILNRCRFQRGAGRRRARLGSFVSNRPLPHAFKQPGPMSTRVKSCADWQWLQLPERLDLALVQDDALLHSPLLTDGRHCLLNMDRVMFVDSTGMGWLIRMHKRIRSTNRQLVLINPHRAVQRALALMHLQDFFASAPDFDAALKLIDNLALEQREWVRARLCLEPQRLEITASAKRLRESLMRFPPQEKAAGSAFGTPRQIVSWRGEITAANADPVWQETEKWMVTDAGASQPLVIDLSQVRFMDSSGLGLMVRARKQAQRQGLQLSFTEPQPAVLNVLRLARLENFVLGELA